MSSQYTTANLANVWEKSNITNIFYRCLTKLAWTFFRVPYSNVIFESGEGRTFFIFEGNRSYILAPKFETLSIPYCVFWMFFRIKWLPLLRL